MPLSLCKGQEGQRCCLGCIGDDDFGRMEMAALQEEGVNVAAVTIHPEASTGVGIAMIDADGENTILGVLGANDYLGPDDVIQALTLHQHTLDGILVNFEVPEPAVAACRTVGTGLWCSSDCGRRSCSSLRA